MNDRAYRLIFGMLYGMMVGAVFSAMEFSFISIVTLATLGLFILIFMKKKEERDNV